MLAKSHPTLSTWLALKHALPLKKTVTSTSVAGESLRCASALLHSSELQRQTPAVSRQDGGMSGSAYQPEPAYVRTREQLLESIVMAVCVFVCEHGNCSGVKGP